MFRAIAISFLTVICVVSAAKASEEKIVSAMSAGPVSLARDATVMDWDGTILREGSNEWTCLPDIPDNGGTDPWCVDEVWLNFLKAYINKTEPNYSQIGIGYMLMGDAPVSNTDPYAESKSNDEDWVEGLGAHLMILVPDPAMLKGISTDPNNGGPWIMWPDTPYQHLMVQIDSYPN